MCSDYYMQSIICHKATYFNTVYGVMQNEVINSSKWASLPPFHIYTVKDTGNLSHYQNIITNGRCVEIYGQVVLTSIMPI